MTAAEKKESLASHLKAFRKMLLVSVAAIFVVFFVLFYLCCTPLVDFILIPVRSRGIEVITTAVSDALMMKFKTCLITAVVLTMPVILWQVWGFIAPALYPNEKKMVVVIVGTAILLFAAGVVFCYVYVFPLAIDLFWQAADGVADTMWSVKEYFNFVLSFVLPFGVMFELPVAIYIMTRHGWVNYKKMAKNRKYVILAIAVIAAFLTPPDVVSQAMLMLPMIVLYEFSVQLTRFVKPVKKNEYNIDLDNIEE